MMSEELLQRDLLNNPEKIGSWEFYNVGSTTINQFKEAGIIRSIDYGDMAYKKVDGLIVSYKNVKAIVENKAPRKFNTDDKKDVAIKQELYVAKKLSAPILIVTDTTETLWINAYTGNKILYSDGRIFDRVFNPKDSDLKKIISDIIQSISESNDKILPKNLVNPTDLAKSIWQDIWSVSGATPENCLYTFVELFIFKYLSDLNILNAMYSFGELIGMYSKNNSDNDVLEYYAKTIRPQIKELFPENVADKTTIINGTIFVSKDQKAVSGYSTVFRKVLEKFDNYGKLEYIDHDFKSKLFESFLKESISKKNWGQFFTPLKVVRAINDMAKDQLKEGVVVCDPACGVGKFPLEFIKTVIPSMFRVVNGQIERKINIVGFDKGFDKDEQKTIILAKANMLIYFCDLIKDNIGLTKEFAKVFNDSFTLKTNSILGTLSEVEEEKYDLILTNPPYVTSGSSNLKDEIEKDIKLKNFYKINGMGVEGLFMEWIIKSLKKGGKAFIIVPDGTFNRQQSDKGLRKYILDSCYLDAVISLPTKTFFKTPKKTYILAITKKEDASDVQIDPVFTYLVSEIGESRDIYRFDIDQDDLKEAVNLYNAFKGSKQFFNKINTDKRCKVVDIADFRKLNDWCIDKVLWSTQEKEVIGMLEKESSVSIDEFADLCRDFSESLLNYSMIIRDISDNNESKN